MGFWEKLLFRRRKRNVAVTTRNTAPETSDVKEDGAEMDKITSDIASQTSDVKEEMGLKWIKQPATLPRKHPTLRKRWG